MTMLAESTRPYHRLDMLDRLIIDERIKNFLRYAQRVRPKVTVSKSATVSPLPERYAANPQTGYNATCNTSGPDRPAMAKTGTQRRRRRPRVRVHQGQLSRPLRNLPLYRRERPPQPQMDGVARIRRPQSCGCIRLLLWFSQGREYDF